jgi:putative methyltransferase (TIGR04325 family)
MDFYASGERLLRNAWRLPVVGRLMRAAYDRHFATLPPNRFRGAYPDFATAEASIPRGGRAGYDHPEMQGMYRLRMDAPCESDWAVLFHLRELLRAGDHVFDFGGHVGVAWYGWRRHLPLLEQVRWQVCDVPAIADEGRALARERGATALSFTSTPSEGAGARIVLAAGSLQYVDSPLPDLLAALGPSVEHVLVNKLPVHDRQGYVTVQSTGRAYHAYRIEQRGDFLARMAAAGWHCVDDWKNREQWCAIPFTRDHDVEAYSGFRFDRG